MNVNTLPVRLSELWALYAVAVKISDKVVLMGMIAKELILRRSKVEEIDRALVECAVYSELFGSGMIIVMFASEYAREAFRKRLVEAGAVPEVRRLAVCMAQPLSRAEIVFLGNRYKGGLPQVDITNFLKHAAMTEGMTPLDLKRLHKQLEPEAGSKRA